MQSAWVFLRLQLTMYTKCPIAICMQVVPQPHENHSEKMHEVPES